MPDGRYRIFIKEGSNHYLVGRLIQQKSDVSLMLQIEPSKQLDGSKIGKIVITSDTFEIPYAMIDIPIEIEHTTIHATGQSHTKLSDGTYSINYDRTNSGISLVNLKTVKHMGTLITREMLSQDVVLPSRKTDIIIERNVGQRSSIIDLLAVPSDGNINFNVDWDMENDRPVQLTIGLFRVPFTGFDILLFTRSSDQFDSQPPGTIHLPDMNSLVPFVLSMDEKKVIIRLSGLAFEEVINLAEGENNIGGMTTISVTPKYL